MNYPQKKKSVLVTYFTFYFLNLFEYKHIIAGLKEYFKLNIFFRKAICYPKFKSKIGFKKFKKLLSGSLFW